MDAENKEYFRTLRLIVEEARREGQPREDIISFLDGEIKAARIERTNQEELIKRVHSQNPRAKLDVFNERLRALIERIRGIDDWKRHV
jgi:hypothetical protein